MDYESISKNINGTQTYDNLKTALQGEALAHLKYQFYRSKLIDINKNYEPVLDEIIHNEKEHGKIWFKLLHQGNIPDNMENLTDAIAGETYEAEEMYQLFGDTAHEEGFPEIAELFYNVAEIESNHALTFESIKIELEKDYLFKSFDGNTVKWKCGNCGFVCDGIDAPTVCPVCNHPQKYFKRL